MSIYERQYQKVLSQELLKYFLLGISPNVEQISNRLSEALGKDGKSTYQYVPQLSHEVFNINIFNKALKQIRFDLETFQEELFDLIQQSYSKINYADLYNKVHSYQLTELQKKLETILFTAQNADFYFLGVFDTFSDTSKLDRDNSTEGVIDLSEQALSLPYGSRGTQKIKTRHMIGVDTWPVEILLPESSNIKKASKIVGSSFQNIFLDTISSWVYEVISTTDEPAEIRFVFPIAGGELEEKETFLNRIEIINHSSKKQKITLRVSSDNVNFLPITGYEEGIILEDPNRIYGLDFETNLVQYLEVTLRKESADAEIGENNSKQYQYLFGLKNLSFYKTGRFNKAVYQSKPYEIGEDQEVISRVSLESNSVRPPNTSINYSVALENTDGTVSNFIPIRPIGEPSELGTAEVVNFGTSSRNSIDFAVPRNGDLVYGTPFQGKYFYKLGDPISPEPIFGSALLYRGFNGWARDKSRGLEIKQINDVYLSFAQTDIEALYDLKIEVPQFEQLPDEPDGTRRAALTLTRPPYYVASRGHSLIPENNSQSLSNNISPNYAIYSIKQNTNSERKEDLLFIPTTRVQLPSNTFILNSSVPDELPILRSFGTIFGRNTIYRKGIDYIFETETFGESEKPTGWITIPAGSSLVDENGNIKAPGQVFRFSWKEDPEITHKVSAIDNNTITLRNISLPNDASLEIEYRFIPTNPSEIIKASIRVSNGPSSATNRIFYVEGKDYAVDASTGNIQRIPTGSIPSDGSVYVEFSYRNAENAVETFQTWCFIPTENGTQIKFDLDISGQKNTLVADTESGEGFFVNTPQGLIELTNASSTPLLNQGWVQFIVRSKNPDANTIYRSNLIDQVIQLRDVDKKRVFLQNSRYFKEITAFRNPLNQRTLNHLRVNTLASDNSVFAIDNITNPEDSCVVVNFKPGNVDTFYNRLPSPDQTTDDRPELFDELFRLVWSSKATTRNIGNKLIVRIELERNSNSSEAGLTPKVFDYSIRASV